MHYKTKEITLLSILVLFHTVGVFTLFSETWRSVVLPLSAFNLLLSFLVLVFSFHKNRFNLLIFLSICFVFGMLVELIGVKTAYLFGSYHYEENLGPKFMGVPFIIGINWGILVVTSGVVAQSLFSNSYLKAFFASLLMTLLDFLIEPVAIASSYWQWENNQVPIYNYVSWFLLSLPLNFLFTKFKFQEQNRVAIGLYLIFVCFFSILNFY